MNDSATLLRVNDLSLKFTGEREVHAVRGISFAMNRGESVAIVGESGSGKSVTAMSLARLLPEPPARYVGGSIELDGVDVLTAGPQRLRKLRGGVVSYVFQEPSTSLNPVFTIRSQIAEAIKLHRPEVTDVDTEIVRWLDLVGIQDAAKRMRDYPHQLSGGMQQRAMIAMALSTHPDLLVADEPTTALDVTIQAQIIDLLKDLRSNFGMAILLITHNFGIIKDFAERVLVMYRGEIVEQGPTAQVLSNPQHPYTRALIECVPRLGQHRKRLMTIEESMAAAGIQT
jgi:ABC-type dipeptide/oligopeptide/nickel transport system ATPase component